MKIFLLLTYNTVSVGSVLMRATLLFSDSAFQSIFETVINLRKCGHARGRAADEHHTLCCRLLDLLRITKHLESMMYNINRWPYGTQKHVSTTAEGSLNIIIQVSTPMDVVFSCKWYIGDVNKYKNIR